MVDDCGLRRTEQVSSLIHVAVLNAVIILETLASALGVYHTILDLAKIFKTIFLVARSQDQFIFTCVEQQWTFQVLPQGYLPNSTVSWGGSLICISVLPQSVKWAHCTKDKLFMYEDLSLLWDTVQTLLELSERG